MKSVILLSIAALLTAPAYSSAIRAQQFPPPTDGGSVDVFDPNNPDAANPGDVEAQSFINPRSLDLEYVDVDCLYMGDQITVRLVRSPYIEEFIGWWYNYEHDG